LLVAVAGRELDLQAEVAQARWEEDESSSSACVWRGNTYWVLMQLSQ